MGRDERAMSCEWQTAAGCVRRGWWCEQPKAISMRDLDDLFAALADNKFRSRQRLNRKDRAYLEEKCLSVLVGHARSFIAERLAPAAMDNDGRQTPMRGHPVFVAQHATATCCRGCLAKWHQIGKGKALSQEEVEHVLDVITRWLVAEGAQEKPLPLFPEDK